MYIAVICSPYKSQLSGIINLLHEVTLLGHQVELWGDWETQRLAFEYKLGFRHIALDSKIKDVITQNPRNTEYYTKFAFPLAQIQIPQVLKYCEQHKPDILWANTRIYSAIIVSKITGIPLINHCYSGDSVSHKPEELYGFYPSEQLSDRKMAVMLNLIRQFYYVTDTWFNENICKKYHLPDENYVAGLSSELCVFVLSIPELCKARKAELPYLHFIGPLIDIFDKGLNHSERKYCYVSLGTWPIDLSKMIELYKLIINNIPAKYDVVVGLGGIIEPKLLGFEEKRIKIYKYADQLSLISKASFVICHGGSNSVHEALYFGKQIIGIPFQPEHRELLYRAELLEIAIRLDPNTLTGESIHKAIKDITGLSQYRKKSLKLSQKIKRINGKQLVFNYLANVKVPTI